MQTIDFYINELYIVHYEYARNRRSFEGRPQGQRPLARGAGEAAWHEPCHHLSDRERHRGRDRRAQADGAVRGAWAVDSGVDPREAADAVRAERGESWHQDGVL